MDPALLIEAEDERSVGWGKVKTDDFAHLVDEQRIVRQLDEVGRGELRRADRRDYPPLANCALMEPELHSNDPARQAVRT